MFKKTALFSRDGFPNVLNSSSLCMNWPNPIWEEYNLRNIGGGNIAHPSILAEARRRKKQKESPQNYDHAPYVLLPLCTTAPNVLLPPPQFWLKCKLTGTGGVATLMPSLNNVSLKHSFATILNTKKQVFPMLMYLPILQIAVCNRGPSLHCIKGA